jgi:cyclic beta-1,2-glucan synthetase
VAADVYGETPHAGRGGWTWYTGSAGWLYRAGLEWILGFRLRENRLTLAPCVPSHWPRFTIHYRHRQTPYEITVDQQPGADSLALITVDGKVLKAGNNTVELVDDGAAHAVHVAWLTAPNTESLSIRSEPS